MTYNQSLVNIVPAASDFSVLVNSVPKTVNSVAISGTKVLLTLANAVVYGDSVTVAYTKPVTNPLQSVLSGQVASLSAQTVTVKVSVSNTPIVKIYPNPAHDYINIRIDEPTLLPDFIRIINFSGKVVFHNNVNPNIKYFQIPINLIQGVYIVQMGSGDLTLFTQKLIVRK